MNKWRSFRLGFVVLFIGSTAMAQEQGVIKPQLLLSEIIQGMPRGEKQEVRVLTASFKPRDKTLFHTHRFPVTVYVLEGAFTLEMEGREPVTVKGWSGYGGTTEREDDGPQSQRNGPDSARDLLRERPRDPVPRSYPVERADAP